MTKEAKKYTVKALAVSGNGNKVFKSGDVVTELNFPPGNAEKLVEKGFLVAAKVEAPTVNLETEMAKSKALAALNSLRSECTTKGIDFKETDGADVLSQLIADFDASQPSEIDLLKTDCSAKGIVFDAEASVDDLKKLLADFQYNIDLANAKAVCDAKGIEYDDDATLESLNSLITAFDVANPSAQFEGKKFNDSKGVEKVAKVIDDITKKELMSELTKSNVEFDSNDAKQILWDVWIKL